MLLIILLKNVVWDIVVMFRWWCWRPVKSFVEFYNFLSILLSSATCVKCFQKLRDSVTASVMVIICWFYTCILLPTYYLSKILVLYCNIWNISTFFDSYLLTGSVSCLWSITTPMICKTVEKIALWQMIVLGAAVQQQPAVAVEV